MYHLVFELLPLLQRILKHGNSTIPEIPWSQSPHFYAQKHFPLGWRHKGDQEQGGTAMVGVGGRGEERWKDEENKSFHKQTLFLLVFSLRSKKLLEIYFYFILLYFCYVLKSISCLKKMKLMISYVKIPQLNFPLSWQRWYFWEEDRIDYY